MPSIALAGVAFAAQYLLGVGSLAFWIARDADARGSGHVRLWGLGSVLTNGLVGVVYFLARSDIGERTRPHAGLNVSRGRSYPPRYRRGYWPRRSPRRTRSRRRSTDSNCSPLPSR